MENELGCIADDTKRTRVYTKFWGDQYLVAGSALRTMRDLLLVRLQEVDREIAQVKKGEGETDGM